MPIVEVFMMNDLETLTCLKIQDAGGDCQSVTTQSDGVFCAMFMDATDAPHQAVIAAGYDITNQAYLIDPQSATPYTYIWFKDKQDA